MEKWMTPTSSRIYIQSLTDESSLCTETQKSLIIFTSSRNSVKIFEGCTYFNPKLKVVRNNTFETRLCTHVRSRINLYGNFRMLEDPVYSQSDIRWSGACSCGCLLFRGLRPWAWLRSLRIRGYQVYVCLCGRLHTYMDPDTFGNRITFTLMNNLQAACFGPRQWLGYWLEFMAVDNLDSRAADSCEISHPDAHAQC